MKKIADLSRFWRWLIVLVWMLVIFLFSSQPHSGRESEKYLRELNVPVRKFAHVCEYLILSILLRWAVNGMLVVRGTRAHEQKHEGQSSDQQTSAGACDIKSVEQANSSSNRSIHALESAMAFAIAAVYAASDEWHQSFIPGRSSNCTDVLVDLVGVTIGVLLWFLISRNHRPPDGAER